MPCSVRRLSLISGCFLALCAFVAHGQVTLVHSVNYDLKLTAGDDVYQVSNHARVRDGHAIPVELGRYRADIAITEISPGKYTATLTLYERLDGAWMSMNVEGTVFSGETGIPIEFAWNSAGVAIDLAMIASVERP